MLPREKSVTQKSAEARRSCYGKPRSMSGVLPAASYRLCTNLEFQKRNNLLIISTPHFYEHPQRNNFRYKILRCALMCFYPYHFLF